MFFFLFLLISRGKVLSCSFFFPLGKLMQEKSICHNTGLDNDMQKHQLVLYVAKFYRTTLKKDTPLYADIYFNVTKLRKKTSFVYGYFENVTSIVMSCCKICVYTHPGNSNYNLTASPIACTDMTRLSRDIFCHIN